MPFENNYLFFFGCFLAQHFLKLFDGYRFGIVISLLPGRSKFLDIVADFLILNTLNTGFGVCPPGIIHDRLHHGLILRFLLNITDETHIYLQFVKRQLQRQT